MYNITDLDKKFKDRSPEETIELIYNFFQNLGLEIQTVAGNETKSGSYWCRVLLFKDGKPVLGTNGKGTTPTYSTASGFAEMYERYCGGFCLNDYNNHTYFHEMYDTYGYFYEPNEKYLNYTEIRNSCSRIKNSLNNISITNNSFLKILSLVYSLDEKEVLPCVECKNLNPNKESLWANPLLLLRLFGSDGLSTGNTIEEAITQGLSEVYEHYAWDKIYLNTPETFYELDVDHMELPYYIIKMIQNIRESGDQIHFFDLSYNFNYPVVLGCYVNKDDHNWSLDLGANPVFEIALERVITELYQGRTNNDWLRDHKTYMEPNRLMDPYKAMFKESSSFTLRNVYPEEILLHTTLVNTYNKEIFLENREYSNKELNDYFRDLNEKCDFDVYIYDQSRMKEVKSIRVLVANKDVFAWKTGIFNNLSAHFKDRLAEYGYELFKNYLTNFDIDIYKFYSFKMNLLTNDDIYHDETISNFVSLLNDGEYDLTYFYKDCLTLLNVYNLRTQKDSELDQRLDYETCVYLNTLYRYKISNLYTKEEIKTILQKGCLFNLDTFDDDFENVTSFTFLFNKLIFAYMERIKNNRLWRIQPHD